jgi:ferredoxin-nitrite reductase
MRYSSVAAALAALQVELVCGYTLAPSVAVGRAQPHIFMRSTDDVEMVAQAPSRTGTSFLPDETKERAAEGNPIEKAKLAKDGTTAFTNIYEFAAAIRAGSLAWEDIEKADMDTRLKWVGLLHRSKRAPGTFMMRLRTPNGLVNSDLMRFYADSVEPYGPDLGVVDITTRQNIQLRGITVEDAPTIIDGLHARNQTSFQSALDNVRNMVGSPLAGIDPLEMVDTRPFCNALNDLISLNAETGERGNPVWGNLPRKFNIAVSGGRDDYSHTHINDIGFQPCMHATTGEMGFNVVFGGYMSIKRVAASVPIDMWIPAEVEAASSFSFAVLRIFRDEGARGDRQKARLMWLVEEYGIEAFREKLVSELAGTGVRLDKAQAMPTDTFERREILGVHPQLQPDLSRVGVHVPVGRLSADECRQIADLADKYSAGEIRLTVEQNLILPNVANSLVDDLLKEPAVGPKSRLSIAPGNIAGHTVSCTGSQFCGLAIIETKNSADRIAKLLQEKVIVPKPLRIHWTGCPNSCGQVQAADIGIMGAPARKKDPKTGKAKAVPGCNIFVGGTIGEHSHLSLDPYKKGVPLEDDDLLPELIDIIVTKFNGKLKRKKFLGIF